MKITEELCRQHEKTIHAVMRYVTAPKDAQLDGIRAFLCREFGAQKAEIEMIEDKSLIGGFVLLAAEANMTGACGDVTASWNRN